MKKAEQVLIQENGLLQDVRKQITVNGEKAILDLEKKFAQELERAKFKARQDM